MADEEARRRIADEEARRRVAGMRAALLAGTRPDGPPSGGVTVPTPGRAPSAGATDRGGSGADGEADDLRRRAMEAASRAYSAAHGHPLDLDRSAGHARPRARWTLDRRSGTVLLAVLGLLALLVASRSALASTDPGPVQDDVAVLGAPARTGGYPAAGEGGTGDVGAGSNGHVTSGAGLPVGEAAGEDGPGPPPLGAGATHGATGHGEASAAVLVHVVGEVRHPGVVRLQPGARVVDALEAAGGPTDGADLSAVNLARVVVDGEQVHVPAPGEVLPSGPVVDPASTPGLVDLNRADQAALDALPGVGPVLAERILDWRDTHGRFSTVEELAEVSGIGPRVLDGLRDLVTVG